MTLAELFQILDEITYLLKAHQWCDISGVLSNTRRDHVLAGGTSKPQLGEFYKIFNDITYSLMAHPHHEISNMCLSDI